MDFNHSYLPELRWRKRGKIFDPSDHDLPLGCKVFAQGPQALQHEGGWRVYFSSRVPDNGMYLSKVCYADFDSSFTTMQRLADHNVISLGTAGCFDEHGIFPFHVTKIDEQILGYTSGWSRRISVPVETGIGLSLSNDNGKSFTRYAPGPVLAAAPHEPFLVGDPFVKKFNGTFHMWYIFGCDWKLADNTSSPDRVYKIGHAISPDGITWHRSREGTAIVSDVLGQDECQAYPSVVRIHDGYWMIFCYRYANDFRTNTNRGYRLGAAYSHNLEDWRRMDEKLFFVGDDDNAWDKDMMCYPHIAQNEEGIWLLYNGNAFGRDGFGVAKLEG